MSWDDLSYFLAALPENDRERLARHAGLEFSGDADSVAAGLRAYAAQSPGATPSAFLATTGVQAGFARDTDLALRIGEAALDLAATNEDRQLARVSLAQTHFQNRRDEGHLAAFEEHCRVAVELGHAGTFCYERLATLYEYRGDLEEAASICRRAIETLSDAGDTRSVERFEKRLRKLSGKQGCLPED